MEQHLDFLGTGWKFPPEFNKDAGTVLLVSDEQDINESLNILLSTSLGERVMQPAYGCNLADSVFETLNPTIVGYIKDRVQNAILFYEPRIVVQNIEVTPDDSPELLQGRFLIRIEYVIPETNSRFNYVYDYYKNEALRPI
ncbi:GPW/gp25 family protein [Chitinophagaceae bacterium 26-R-25]|nr:GPW/gp25 family protein [Chitinophagaceae bacterium 26-R-25]